MEVWPIARSHTSTRALAVQVCSSAVLALDLTAMASLTARTATIMLATVVLVGLGGALMSNKRAARADTAAGVRLVRRGESSGVDSARSTDTAGGVPDDRAGVNRAGVVEARSAGRGGVRGTEARQQPAPHAAVAPSGAPPGECIAAYGKYTRPAFVEREDMLASLPAFLDLYDKRKANRRSRGAGGMRLDHSFAVWLTATRLKPSAIIESGVYNGHSTWLFRKARPEARVFALDPAKWKSKHNGTYYKDTSGLTTYYKGKKFKDFADIDWDKEGIDKSTTLVFIDDHQDAVRRLMEGARHGFRHFMFEDNYEPLDPRTDFLSIKQACDPAWEHQFPEAKDNFGRVTRKRGPGHAKMWSRVLASMLDEYYEFPPVVAPALIPDEKLIYDLAVTTPPLLGDDASGRALFEELGLQEQRFRDYLGHYGHICYLSIAADK